MKKKVRTRIIRLKKDYRTCRLYNNIGSYLQELEQLPDAAAVRKAKIQSAPIPLVEMVF